MFSLVFIFAFNN